MAKTIVKKPQAKKVVQKSKDEPLFLRNVLDISYAGKFYNELMGYVSKTKGGVILDASPVERITTPCVQIILSLFIKSIQEGISVKIINSSQNFKQAFTDLGLENELLKYSN